MEKLSKNKVWQATAFLVCAGVLWTRLIGFDASEFSGGRITGKLFTMAEVGSLLFLVALLLTIFYRRVAAAIALAATLLGLPFYLYILMPGPNRQIFKGEYSIPLQRPFVWNNWAVIGVLSLVIATFSSLHSLSSGRARLAR
jgi:Na+(H+)/acetate symporter ActP